MENEEEKFHAYKKVQEGGATNMFDVNAVADLSNYVLNKNDCIYIMKHYSELDEKYGK